MASLTQKNGRWHIAWRDEAGRVRRKSTGCTIDQREKAEKLLKRFEIEGELEKEDPFRKHRKRPISEHVDEYHAHQIATGTTEKQASEVQARLTRLFGKAKITRTDQITEDAIERVVVGLRNKPQKKGKREADMPLASTRTRNTYRTSAKSFANWLYRNRRTATHQLIGLRKENEQTDIRRPRAPLTDEEFRRVYQAAISSTKTVQGFDGETRAMIYLLALRTGLRRKEIASLTPASFDLKSKNPALTLEAKHSKHRKLDIVHLPKDFVPVLRAYLRGRPKAEPLFPKLAQRQTHKMIRADMKAAGVPVVVDGKHRLFHSLRHQYITRCWDSGASPKVIRELARHSDIRTTLRYSHTDQSELRNAVDAIPELPLTG